MVLDLKATVADFLTTIFPSLPVQRLYNEDNLFVPGQI
jgi:hypothetical protein